VAGAATPPAGRCPRSAAGAANLSSGLFSSISGGGRGVAGVGEIQGCDPFLGILGNGASITGGLNNLATGDWSSVGGGTGNTATGPVSSVSGGLSRSAGGSFNWAAGSLTQDH
jgi:hypothetical protein